MSRWHKTEFDMLPEQAFQPRPGGGMTLEGGGGGNSSSSAEIYTAMKQVEMSEDQLAWAKELYKETAPEREAATNLASQVSQAQLAQMQQQTNMASAADQDYRRNYLPLEQEMIQEARSYNSEARREAEAGRAVSDVTQQFGVAADGAVRGMQRAGVNPSDGKMQGVRQGLVAQEALARATAANTARRQVETVGAARMADAVNLGRNIASSQGTNAALALNQGNAATANAGAALAAQNSGAQNMQAAYGGARAGYQAAGNTFGNISAANASADAAAQGNMAAGVGAAATVAVVI